MHRRKDCNLLPTVMHELRVDYIHRHICGIMEANAVEELKEVMKVRAKALSQFGEKNIRPGMPMAMLEDVLVPVYFFHRYQLEAATKVVGGMYYTYALRGDGQVVTKAVSKNEQLKALNAIMDCMDPQCLNIT